MKTDSISENKKMLYGTFIADYIEAVIIKPAQEQKIVEMNNELYEVLLHDTNILARKFKRRFGDKNYLGNIKKTDGEPLDPIFDLTDEVFFQIWKSMTDNADWAYNQYYNFNISERNNYIKQIIENKLIDEFNKEHPKKGSDNNQSNNTERYVFVNISKLQNGKYSEIADINSDVVLMYEKKHIIIESVRFICEEVRIPATALAMIYGKIINTASVSDEILSAKSIKCREIHSLFYGKKLREIYLLVKDMLFDIIGDFPGDTFASLENNLNRTDKKTGKAYNSTIFLLSPKQISQNIYTYEKNHKIFETLSERYNEYIK